jgi:hypothetical protein
MKLRGFGTTSANFLELRSSHPEMKTNRSLPLLLLVLLALCIGSAFADEPSTPPILQITRAATPIAIDGDLSDAGWSGALKVERWYETNPGDNIEPKMKNVGYLAYDDKFLYAGFELADPHPEQIRAPFTDHDNVGGTTTDYAGIILDTRNDGKTAILFLATPRGIQYDAVSDDTSGNEDSSPDFYWDSAAKITKDGWVLEMRIPFTSLRYDKTAPMTWGIQLYRNMPRDRRYQMFANKLPRNANCFICNESKLVGLENLPSGGHFVAAPYISVKEQAAPRDGVLGNAYVNAPATGDGGLDVKWTPTANHAIDGTLNPDFSQVESDVAQISANERFALFLPEKRPFFLEGVELFTTPIQAVYTRTITSPRWGLRSTGKLGSNAYTVLIADDRGGGSTILPGSNGSDFADQDFGSRVAIARVRHDLGQSFVSMLITDREVSGGGHNRVLGPDFQWRPTKQDNITGQILFSDTSTPNRPELATEWDGRQLRSHAANIWWSHSNEKWDFYTQYLDYGKDFRADDGFVPQVGFRENYVEGGRTFRPKDKFFSRVRVFAMSDYQSASDGKVLFRQFSGGFGGDAKWASQVRFRYAVDNVRSGEQVFNRHQLLYSINFNPTRAITNIGLSGWVGQDVDFFKSRLGKGARITVGGTLRPTDHLELRLYSDFQSLTVNGLPGTPAKDDRGRLFTAQVERIRGTYTFSSRMFARAIVQNVRTNRNLALYAEDVSQHSGNIQGSVLFAYKLNWQTVMFVGLGDSRAVDDANTFQRNDRQFFLKLSYAFQQ